MKEISNWMTTGLSIITIAICFCQISAMRGHVEPDEIIGEEFWESEYNEDIQKLRPNTKLVDLNEDNWNLMLQGEWMVEFFAPWCPACKNLAATWDHFATMATKANVKVATIDVTTSPSLSGRFFVTALPTIYHVKDGQFRQYRGSRDGDALMNFLQQKQWKKIDPLSAWKKPDTIHMSILSYFFKLSHTLKDFNVRLQEEYGLPTWGSYALFAFATIFFGAAFGLLMVCIVDFLYPPKKTQRQSFSETNKTSSANDLDDDMALDEIEDERDDDENADVKNRLQLKDGDNDNDDEEDDDDDETSEGEKYSHSEEDENEEMGEQGEEKDAPSTKQDKEKKNDKNQTKLAAGDASIQEKTAFSSSPSEARKRKPRKAD